MRRFDFYTIGLLFFSPVYILNAIQANQEGSDDGNNMDANIHRLIAAVNAGRISKILFYLAKDPLP